ncbi:MAG TPA: LysR family transcriptional regulator, partial [Achromobacter sp.]|nr:LysR family transcriptional regulator [Achromobacter sp.]
GQAVEALVARGELEVGATILPIAPDGGLAAQPFGRYPIWVIGPPDAPWAGKTSLPLSALRDARLLIPTDDFAITRRLRQAFADAGFQPGIAAQSAHWDFLVAMASAGLGVALLPEPLMQRIKTRGLSTAKLAKSGMQWEVGHIWLRSGYLSFAARAWLEVCDAVLGKPKKSGTRGPAPRAD